MSNDQKPRGQLVLCFSLWALVFALYPAYAQQPKKVPRVAYLSAASAASQVTHLKALWQGLRELGYSEGKNIVIEERYADERRDRLSEFATELLRLKVDIIITGGPTVTRVVKEATSKIPIVMAYDIDPVGNGFVASLAHPGGNITGLASFVPELSGKQLELLKEIVPELSRVAVLGSSIQPGNAQSLREMKAAARQFKLELQPVDVLTPEDIGTAFDAAAKARANAVVVLGSPLFRRPS